MITSHRLGRMYLDHVTATALPRRRRRRKDKITATNCLLVISFVVYFAWRMFS